LRAGQCLLTSRTRLSERPNRTTSSCFTARLLAHDPDGAVGVDVYPTTRCRGRLRHDGFDDFYLCQPAGLPNRLYRNKGDGTFEDVTEKAGWACSTIPPAPCSSTFGIRDFRPSRRLRHRSHALSQSRQRDLFHEARRLQGLPVLHRERSRTLPWPTMIATAASTFTSVCTCTTWGSTVPLSNSYYDARNGPPNLPLLTMKATEFIEERTEETGLNAHNDRYVFHAPGATQTAMDCKTFLWSTTSAVPAFIATTAMGRSRLSHTRPM